MADLCYAECHLKLLSPMLSVIYSMCHILALHAECHTFKPFMPSVFMLNVVMLNVVAPCAPLD